MPTPADISRPASRLTIAVLTHNEAHQIERCLTSAAFADELIVVDSGSSDDTVAIAVRLGATTFVHADWQGFAEQRNRLLAHATGDYILFLDADEEITPALRDDILAAVRSREVAVWSVVWSEVAFGRELKHMVPRKGPARLFKRSLLQKYDGVVHENAVLTDPGAPRHVLRHQLRHYSRQTVYGSLKKLAQYAALGASKRAHRKKLGGILPGLLMSGLTFLRLYVFRLAFTGGGPGFLYSLFIALETFFRYAAAQYDSNIEIAPLKR